MFDIQMLVRRGSRELPLFLSIAKGREYSINGPTVCKVGNSRYICAASFRCRWFIFAEQGKPCSFVLVYLGTNAIGKTPHLSRFIGLFVYILPDCAIIGLNGPKAHKNTAKATIM
jgi:hypothetical protein